MFFLAVANLVASFHLALRDRMIAPVLGAGWLATIGLLVAAGNDPAALATALLAGCAISAGLCVGWTVWWHRRPVVVRR